MSRIGENPITLPEGAIFAFDEQNCKVTVKGPKGELYQTLTTGFKINQEGSILSVERPSDQKEHKALHGLYRALLANMITGVSAGYTRQLELVGVGYKAAVQDNVLELSVGYSHSIFMATPPEVKVQVITKKGSNPIIVLEGIDKQLIGHVGAKIKSLRKKDPYKGKGIYYVGEYVRRKAGKTAAK